ncbi:ATP-dependent DNA ligase [Bradyrhizobium sp. NFR13]|uniref:ATP-dependent DNA ligase n=1 Tax=Bradyrhizobium sp. NFR13 TaxID=1566285 RepID=UPI0008ECC311|nr:ATP-dependent DNA ligase [Bradyrhizobium sp. NFR13]SFM03738.1 ATP-dependent DNA ligase [Bradyrhizobium sp. NFR13]
MRKASAPLAAMEARSVPEIPQGPEWQYEPKWDGFRCILVRDADDVAIFSKSGQNLKRYFPEIVAAALDLKAKSFVLDGEIVVPVEGQLSFDELLQRIHPAASRVKRLAAKTPALYLSFDLLKEGTKDVAAWPLSKRRPLLENFATRQFQGSAFFRLSPASRGLKEAKRWLGAAGGGSDGIIAKRLDLPYQPGNRKGMQKIKKFRSADCVIGGFRYSEKRQASRKVVGSILLGLYDAGGLLHHVGFSSAIKAKDKAALTAKLEDVAQKQSFTGTAPGGPSRWSTKRSSEWTPVRPKYVVEVSYDHFTAGRFRHGTSILRWRPDKRPDQCTMDQVKQKAVSGLMSNVLANA